MRLKYVLSFIAIGLLAAYMGAMGYLMRDYSEAKYIPKVSLSLPTFAQANAIVGADKNTFSVSAPAIEPPPETVLGFQVLFDNMPLENINLIRPWAEENEAAKTYGRPAELDEKPALAFVLTDVGLNEDLFNEILEKLPPIATLSFSVYAKDVDKKIIAARQKGFEGMIDIPVQGTAVFENAGALALREDMTDAQVERLVENSYLGLKVPLVGFWVSPTASLKHKEIIARMAAQKGMVSLTDERAFNVMRDDFYASATRQVLIAGAKKAKEQGAFILVIPAHPSTVEALVNWAGLVEHPEVSIVPVSALENK